MPFQILELPNNMFGIWITFQTGVALLSTLCLLRERGNRTATAGCCTAKDYDVHIARPTMHLLQTDQKREFGPLCSCAGSYETDFGQRMTTRPLQLHRPLHGHRSRRICWIYPFHFSFQFINMQGSMPCIFSGSVLFSCIHIWSEVW